MNTSRSQQLSTRLNHPIRSGEHAGYRDTRKHSSSIPSSNVEPAHTREAQGWFEGLGSQWQPKRSGLPWNLDRLAYSYVEASCERNFCFPETTEAGKIRESPGAQ